MRGTRNRKGRFMLGQARSPVPYERRVNHRTASDLPARFEAFIAQNSFPCVGAKSALSRAQLHFVIEDDLAEPPSMAALRALQRFSREYTRRSKLFRSVVVLFRDAPVLDEAEFEARLWRYLQRLHDADCADWDPRVSDDPSSPNFSFSIGGRGYYVIGLHPGASRRARRFSHPALVFNLHDQFERLRERGTYETLRDSIVARDTMFDGRPNPMLQSFGSGSEARQYSGRQVDSNWRCPFHSS